MGYNGWANRQTWLLNVHDFYEGAFDGQQFADVSELEDAMQSMFEEFLDENLPSNGLINDLLVTSGIDYRELAEHYAADHPEVIAGEEEEDEDEDEDEEEEEEEDEEG